MAQRVIFFRGDYLELNDWFKEAAAERMLLVCGRSIKEHKQLYSAIKELGQKNNTEIIEYNDFRPNPTYEDVIGGLEVYRKSNCSAIIAVGGGSAIDVAKCIKAFISSEVNIEGNSFLNVKVVDNSIPFLAVPTTAGSGSEATRFAVVYYNGEKQSITGEKLLPDTVLLVSDTLISLPEYQKKATMLDALCHAVESFWSINSNAESRSYSCQAIKMIISNMSDYLEGTPSGRRNMLEASYIAGKAINIAQTTAGHAMCYKITGLYGISHGHSAALCNRVLFGYMIDNIDRCIDPRGKEYLAETLDELGVLMGGRNAREGAEKFSAIFESLNMEVPIVKENELRMLVNTVNAQRLGNFPIELSNKDIECIYSMALHGDKL